MSLRTKKFLVLWTNILRIIGRTDEVEVGISREKSSLRRVVLGGAKDCEGFLDQGSKNKVLDYFTRYFTPDWIITAQK